MLEELQRVADGLARSLDRAVAIDDLGFRLLVYTSHSVVVDPVRTHVIMTRQGPPEAIAWARRFHISKARGAVRIPANESLGLFSRVCVPIRAEGVHFGWLWLIDPDESLTRAELDRAEAAGAEAGKIFYLANVGLEHSHARERELLRDLLSDSVAVRDLAAQDLIEEERFTSDQGVVALVVLPIDPVFDPLPEDIRLGLADALDRGSRIVPARESLRLVRPDHGLMVTRYVHLQDEPDLPAELHDLACRQIGSSAEAVVVGVGTAESRLVDAGASYRNALRAARVAEVIPRFRPVSRFEHLGVYGILASFPLAELRRSVIHPGVERLQQIDPDLMGTLELFLDRAGDTKAVAVELCLHRSTVYYRLKRIEEIVGANLDDGEDRLALHLSLKVAKLGSRDNHGE